MSLHRDTYAEINLKYLKENIETTYKKFKRPLMAVIKADAYGHGYREVATYIKDIEYLEMFAVAKQIAAAQTTIVPFFIAGAFYYIFNYIVAKQLSYVN